MSKNYYELKKKKLQEEKEKIENKKLYHKLYYNTQRKNKKDYKEYKKTYYREKHPIKIRENNKLKPDTIPENIFNGLIYFE